MVERPIVNVIGAPGFIDFQGELIMETTTPDGRLLSVIEVADFDNDLFVIESKYVTLD